MQVAEFLCAERRVGTAKVEGPLRRSLGIGTARSMINNPSYAKKPELFHAVALQQQRLASLGLGPPLPRSDKRPPSQRKRPARTSGAGSSGTCGSAPARSSGAGPSGTCGGASVSAQPVQCSECSDDDDANPPPLTLAQRMGLEAVPDPTLTKMEWEVIAERSKDQGRSKEPCAICLGDFTTEPQVLLSCAHVFHRACLSSWERHSKSRCCPVCRKLHYQKRACHDGEDLYRHACAARLQAAWRGQAARRAWGPALRRANPATRRAWGEQRLGSLTDKLVSELDAEHDALDDLFAEIDCSVASSRAVFALQPDGPAGGGGMEWADVEATARARGITECPVCLGALCAGEPLTLLSCSHVYHERCLASFERFSLGAPCRCPVCRAVYTKTTLQLHGSLQPPCSRACGGAGA